MIKLHAQKINGGSLTFPSSNKIIHFSVNYNS